MRNHCSQEADERRSIRVPKLAKTSGQFRSIRNVALHEGLPTANRALNIWNKFESILSSGASAGSIASFWRLLSIVSLGLSVSAHSAFYTPGAYKPNLILESLAQPEIAFLPGRTTAVKAVEFS